MIDRSRFGAAVIAVALALSPAIAQDIETPADDRQQRIDALIADLSSPDAATREAATQQLVEMGPDAQAALEAFVSGRATAEQALNQIAFRKAIEPTLVTLDLKNAAPAEAISQLAEQIGYRIGPRDDSGWADAVQSPITLSVTNAPFWEVMFEVMKQGEFGIYPNGSNEIDGIHVQRRDPDLFATLPRNDHGAFVVLARTIQRNNMVDLSKPDEIQRNLLTQLLVLHELKIKVLRYSPSPRITEAVDDKGNSLAPQRTGTGMNSGNRNIGWSSSLRLQSPPNPGGTIKTLRGNFLVVVQTRSETLAVDNILTTEPVTRKVGDMTVTIHPVQRLDENQYSVRTVIRGIDRSAMPGSRPRLVDADGNAWGSGGGGGASHSDGQGFQSTWSFFRTGRDAAPGAPHMLIWEIPTASQEIEVPFTFHDLPLP